MKTHLSIKSLSIATLLVLTLLACNLSQQVATNAPAGDTPGVVETPLVVGVTEAPPLVDVPTDTLTPTIAHLTIPGELPGSWLSEITDRDTSAVAGEKRAIGGENYSVNLFERPYNANMMDKYFPDLDIVRARLYEDMQWVFGTVHLSGVGDGSVLSGNYGLELDMDIDGRGDLLVFAAAPGSQWSTDGVRVWTDENNDVGSTYPTHIDAPVAGNGYENLLFDSGVGADPDLAWARLAPGDPAIVQIAFKISLLNYDDKFVWGAWADRSVLNPAWFDYNDHFTATEAGSSLLESAEYPIKALYELDNTCRWSVGFTPSGTEPGICPVPPTPTPTLPGTISGIVFNDGINGDLVLDGASWRIAGATVRARSGNCGAPGSVVTTATTNGSGGYTLTVPAGTYCVDVSPDPVSYSSKTAPQTVTVGNGSSMTGINFGYRTYLGMK
jgi:hypothetical protein